MKKLPLFFISLFFLSGLQSFSQKSETVTDTLAFSRQQKLQKHIDMLVQAEEFDFKEKKRFYYDILDTREKAKAFAINLALLNHSQSKVFIERYFEIGEDTTKTLWLISTRLGLPGKVTDGELSIIVKKNDCKILVFSNFL